MRVIARSQIHLTLLYGTKMSALVAIKQPVPYIDLPRRIDTNGSDLLPAIESVLRSGQFVGGSEIGSFESNFATLCGVNFGIAVANGTDALHLTLRALGIGPGDEVITAPNTFLATAGAIVAAGATPVFADVGTDLNLDADCVAAAVTEWTKAIIPVHLTGRIANLDSIQNIADRHNLYVIENAAQAVGAEYRGKRAGSLGTAGCFSLHPLKNLHACGDAGIVVTNDAELAQRIRQYANHGLADRDRCDFWGYNSRLDTIQAAILNVLLPNLEDWTAARRQNASYYSQALLGHVEVPTLAVHEAPVYHTYVIQADNRTELQRHLSENQIETMIHYPIPLHLQPAASSLGFQAGDFPVAEAQADRILSLPIHQELEIDHLETVAESIKEFYAL